MTIFHPAAFCSNDSNYRRQLPFMMFSGEIALGLGIDLLHGFNTDDFESDHFYFTLK